MKCSRCKNYVNTDRSKSLCTACLESGILRNKKSKERTGLISIRLQRGVESVSKGLCKACFVNPIFIERSKFYCKKCFLERKKANTAYRVSHKQENILRNRIYLQNHPEKLKEHSNLRRSRKLKAVGKFTGWEWIKLLDKYKHLCLWCGSTSKLSADHVIPLSRNGHNSIDNIQPLCRSCNSKKGTKILDFRTFGSAILEWT